MVTATLADRARATATRPRPPRAEHPADRGGIAASHIDALTLAEHVETQHVHLPPVPVGVPVIESGTVVVGALPTEPRGYVNRAALAELDQQVTTSTRVVVCAGGRGVGKSVLAAAYARAAITDPQVQVVVWVSGQSELALITGLAVLARRVETARRPRRTRSRPRSTLEDYLSGLDVASLLVIDNAKKTPT